MFTGIVEELGSVCEVGESWLAVACEQVAEGLLPGASISVNGCCLTAGEVRGDAFVARLMDETRSRTTLGGLAVDDPVNLERPLPADGRFGGHLVQGHVDAVGEVVSVDAGDDASLVRIAAPLQLAGYLVTKGSVAVDGCSLTIIDTEQHPGSAGGVVFSVGLVPHTLAVTTLGRRVPGDRVNLEADLIAKYVERLLQTGTDTAHGS